MLSKIYCPIEESIKKTPKALHLLTSLLTYLLTSFCNQMSITDMIVKEFVEQIDNEKEYSLAEMKKILGEIYKTKSKNASSSDSEIDIEKKTKHTKKEKNDVENKEKKREPTAYNNFVKERIKNLKTENPDTKAKDLLIMAAGEWKNLSDEEKQRYKI